MGWVLATASAAIPEMRPEVAAALQAIQQASDPSAAVTAYANGFTVDRNEPKLYNAYVSRMVDFGLPEMAYRQAQTLTTLDSHNGLAWGVVGYVDARRAQMSEALSEIILAGQFAPENKFVQTTAGEILAWYDVKADKSQMPASTRDGVARLHTLFDRQAAFSAAYDTAKKAYQTQAGTTRGPAAEATIPGEQVPPTEAPLVTPPATPPSYGYPSHGYSDYYPPYAAYPDYYGWGPGWVQPAPWWWWQPGGFFVGFSFVPFGSFFVFDDFHHFHNHHAFHNDFHHSGGFHGNGLAFGQAFHQPNAAVTHQHNAAGTATFFGNRATVNPSVGSLGQARFRSDPPVRTTIGAGIPNPTGGQSAPRVVTTPAPAVRSTTPATVGQAASSGPRVTTPPAPVASSPAVRPTVSAPVSPPRSFGAGVAVAAPRAPVMTAPAAPMHSGGFAGGGVPAGAMMHGGGGGVPHGGGGGSHGGGGGHR